MTIKLPRTIIHNKWKRGENGEYHAPQPQAQNLSGCYYWIWGKQIDAKGRDVILGWYRTYDEADKYAYSKIRGDYEIVPLKTRDREAATQIIRKMRLDKTDSIEQTLERFRHQGKDLGIENETFEA